MLELFKRACGHLSAEPNSGGSDECPTCRQRRRRAKALRERLERDEGSWR